MTILCLLHGFAAGGAVWEPYRCIFPNALIPTLRFTTDGMPVLLELTEPTIFVGWSLGGMIAVEMAAKQPEKVKGLVLVSSAPSFVASDLFPEGKPLSALSEMRNGVASGDPRTIQTFQRQLFTAEEIRQGHLARFRREIGPLLTNTTTAELLAQLLFLERWRASLPSSTLPVAVVHGTGDAVIDCAAVTAWRRLFPHASVTTIDGGHALPFVHPRTIASIITSLIPHAETR